MIGAFAFTRGLLADDLPARRHPSLLLCPNEDPFSGLHLLKARYEGGKQPSEDVAGWALSWHLTKKDEFAERAVSGLRALPALSAGAASRSWMQFVGESLAFDWVYEHRSFDSKLKDQITGGLLEAATALLARPDLSQPEQASYHNYVLRYLVAAGFALAAVRGHGNGKQRSKKLREQLGLAWQNILETTQLVTPEGSYHESMDYYRITVAPLALLAELQRTTTGVDPARRYTVFENIGTTYLYKLMPDGTPSREGDNEYPILDDRDTALLGYAVHRFKDPYSAWTLRKSGFAVEKWVLPVLDFLWNDPDVTPRDPALADAEELPRQKFFSGVGHLVMRSGWKADATWIEFNCGPYFSKHQHLSQNHFSIYHRGYLAIDSGADYTETESPHYLNYYRRTVAHNSLLVYDPKERFFWSDNVVDAANDGGQRMDSARFWNTVRSPEDFERTRDLWDLGAMRVVDYKADQYHYAAGDAMHAYSRNKVKRFTRELLYVPGSNAFFIFDRVTSVKANFRKTWLLHGVSEPSFTGTGRSVGHGGTEFSNASTFRFADGGGELTVRCLLPEMRSVVKRGGTGNEFWTPGDERGGDWGSGENWPLEPAEGGPLPEDPRLLNMWKKFWGADLQKMEPSNRKNVVSGAWRVEVSPTVAAEEDVFLHVLEIGETGGTGKKRIELLRGQNVIGAALEAGTFALFNSGPEGLVEGEVTLPAMAGRELVVSGLERNARYEFTFGGPNITTQSTSVQPGVVVTTKTARANEKGIATVSLGELRGFRVRLKRI